MTESAWKNQDTEIAIFDQERDEWQYSIFDNWEEAREAVNRKNSLGKQIYPLRELTL